MNLRSVNINEYAFIKTTLDNSLSIFEFDHIQIVNQNIFISILAIHPFQLDVLLLL